MGFIKTFKHSGNLGDIIYSLPTIISMGGGRLEINYNPGCWGMDIRAHKPNLMNPQSFIPLKTLLETQDYIEGVRLYNGKKFDVDLDIFRNHTLKKDAYKNHIANWHLEALEQKFDLSQPWITNIKPLNTSKIVICHNMRYVDSAWNLDWNLLKDHEDNCLFIGFEDEHEKFMGYSKLNMPRLETDSLLEIAMVIKGSELFVGNQTFGFALAEAMKVQRVQDVWLGKENCLPQSNNGYVELSKVSFL